MPRCPSHYQTPDIAEAVRAYGNLVEYHVLPVAGGMQDQAAHFVRFVRVLSAEIELVRKEAKRD